MRVFNQFTETFSVMQLATEVCDAANSLGYNARIEHCDNPRVELEEHYYNPTHTRARRARAQAAAAVGGAHRDDAPHRRAVQGPCQPPGDRPRHSLAVNAPHARREAEPPDADRFAGTSSAASRSS